MTIRQEDAPRISEFKIMNCLIEKVNGLINGQYATYRVLFFRKIPVSFVTEIAKHLVHLHNSKFP